VLNCNHRLFIIYLNNFLSSHIYKLQLPPGYEKIEKKAKHNFRKKRRKFLEKYMCQDVCNLIIKKNVKIDYYFNIFCNKH
jgi:hypothetical protein